MFKLDVPTTVFLAITVISVGFVVLPLWNYTRFYLALYNFGYVLLDVTVDASQIEAIQVNVSLLAMNPTDYSGLEVSSVLIGLEYFWSVHEVLVPVYPSGVRYVTTRWWDLKMGSITGVHPLDSNSNETILLTISVNPNSNIPSERDNAQSFMNYVRTKPAQILWSVSCALVLLSFLGGFEVDRDFTPDNSLGCVTAMSY